eukprot:SAG31_NODE_53_length_30139_cov_31.002197_23_plen_449_part_00
MIPAADGGNYFSTEGKNRERQCSLRRVILWGLVLGTTAVEHSSQSSDRFLKSSSNFETDWSNVVEDAEQCPHKTKRGVTCTWEVGGQLGRHFKFPAGIFKLSHQVYVPANTIIEGAKNPNDMNDPEKKPREDEQTFFVVNANAGLRDGRPYCKKVSALTAKRLRPGFLLSSNTTVFNINFQGADTRRGSDNGDLCGGGVFETPGCVRGEDCEENTGNGKAVQNVHIENVRLNDLYFDEHQFRANPTAMPASQVALWVPSTKDGTQSKNISVDGLVSMYTHADGVNFHGGSFCRVANSFVARTGDDVFAVWNSEASDIEYNNCTGLCPGCAMGLGVNGFSWCVATYGFQTVSFTDITCLDRTKPLGANDPRLRWSSSMMARINYLFTSSVSTGHGKFTASGWKWLDMESKVPIDDFRPLCAHSANFKDDNMPIFSPGFNCSNSFQGNFF